MRNVSASGKAALAVMLGAALVMPAPSANAMIIAPTAGNCGYHNRQICTGAGLAVPVGLGTLSVVFSCTAVSPFVVDRTGVGCYLRGMSDNGIYAVTGPLFTVGNQSTIPNVRVSVPFQGYWLCVGAGYSTATGASQPVQNYRSLA